MKKLKSRYKQGFAIFSICIVLFATPFVLAKCTKGSDAGPKKAELRDFVGSPVYKDFIGRNRVMGKVDVDAARIVRVDNAAALVHIPVMKHANVEGAIIGLPIDRMGHYELMYQDNRAALSGTGNIYLYTSANELFARIELKNGVIKTVEPQESPGIPLRVNCGFMCRLNKCYNEVKMKFPGDAICGLLDIFMGVCTSATVATCLIRMATN